MTGPDGPTASATAAQGGGATVRVTPAPTSATRGGGATTTATTPVTTSAPASSPAATVTAGPSGEADAGANLAHTGGNGTVLALTATAGLTLTAAGAILVRRRNRGGSHRARVQR